MEGADFTSGPGYLSTETFSLLAPLMLIGPGIALGTGAIATEEERGTLDLLMASPVSRGRVLAAKALGSIAALIATATVLYLTVLITANALDMRISAGMLAQAVSAVQVLACACGGVTFLAHGRTVCRQDRLNPMASARTRDLSPGGHGLWPQAARKVPPYGDDRVGCPLVGGDIVGRGSGAAGRRVAGCRGAAAAVLRSGV